MSKLNEALKMYLRAAGIIFLVILFLFVFLLACDYIARPSQHDINRGVGSGVITQVSPNYYVIEVVCINTSEVPIFIDRWKDKNPDIASVSSPTFLKMINNNVAAYCFKVERK